MSSDPERKTVLVVTDDNEFARSLLCVLGPGLWEFRVYASWKTASSGLVSGLQPDLAIIDLHLGNNLPLDGITVIQQLAERWPDLPIVALTGHPDSMDAARKSLAAGAVQFLKKPVQIDDLSERLLQAIWIKEHQAEAEKLDRIEERDRRKRLANTDEPDQYVPTVSRLLERYTDRLHQMLTEAASVVQRMHQIAGLPDPPHRDAEWQLAISSVRNLSRGFRRIEAGVSQLCREVSQRLEHGHLNEAVRIDWVVRLADLEASLAQARDDFSSKETYLAEINPSNAHAAAR